MSNSNAPATTVASNGNAVSEATSKPQWDAPVPVPGSAGWVLTDEGHALFPDAKNKRMVIVLDMSEPVRQPFGKEGEKDYRVEITMARIGGVGRFGKRCQVEAEGLPRGKALSLKADCKLTDATEVRLSGKAERASVW